MYLQDIVVINFGCTENLAISPQFDNLGRPKPLILVGTNGTGKTGLLSSIADGLVEIAALHFRNATTYEPGGGRRFFKITGGRTLRVGASYQLALLKFVHENYKFYYQAKSGTVGDILTDVQKEKFAPVSNFASPENKLVQGPKEEIDTIFTNGVYVFFPSTRFETPYWTNSEALDRGPEGEFSAQFTGMLRKKIIIESSATSLKPWMMDIMLDAVITFSDALSLSREQLTEKAQNNLSFWNTYLSLNKIVQLILRREDARIVWYGRRFGERKIGIAFGDQMGVPSIDNLSTGQSSLFSIFATIIQHGDAGAQPRTIDQIEGVVVIDEVDEHLHADLQYDVLPELIKIFPRIQFILTSHSPLFLMGMKKVLGLDGFSTIELPLGLTIDPEQFSEFERSFSYFKESQRFNIEIKHKVEAATKPLVLCEGETDPIYLRAAALLCGLHEFLERVEFDWVGLKSNVGAKGGGKDALNKALALLRLNPGLTSRRVVLLYDSDVNKLSETYEHGLFVYGLPLNRENLIRPTGIENLLPEEVFEDRFFTVAETTSDSGDKIKRTSLKKAELCNYLCEDKRDASDFVKFREPLLDIKSILWPPADPTEQAQLA